MTTLDLESPGKRALERSANAAMAKADHDHASRRVMAALFVHGGRWLLLLVLLVIWQMASKATLDPFFFSRPISILSALRRLAATGELWNNVWVTLLEAFLGFCIGSVIGTASAVALGSSPRVYAVFEPFILILFATPAVAIAPLIIVWFGIGLAPKVVLAAWFVFCIVLLNGVSGVRSAPAGWLSTARLMGASGAQVFWKIKLRGAVPQLLAGYKSALPQSVIGAMVGEFISARHGIGYLIAEASGKFDTATAFAAILVLAILVLLMFFLLQIGANAVQGEAR